MGCFPRDFKSENGPLRHTGKGPLRSENGPSRSGNAPSRLMGCFQAPPWWKTAPLKRPIQRSMTFLAREKKIKGYLLCAEVGEKCWNCPDNFVSCLLTWPISTLSLCNVQKTWPKEQSKWSEPQEQIVPSSVLACKLTVDPTTRWTLSAAPLNVIVDQCQGLCKVKLHM